MKVHMCSCNAPFSTSRQWPRILLSALLCALLLTQNGCQSGAAPRERGRRLPFPGSRRSTSDATTNIVPTVVAYRDYRDPLIGFNRVMFAFNDVSYRYLLIPLSRGYMRIMPDAGQRCVGNFFFNIKTPIYAVNHLLQFKPAACGRDLLRFAVNSTIGILGLFDPADAWWDISREETHLEDTLAQYGMGYGIYLVLPILGPSDLRNGASSVGDYFLNPIPYVTENPATTAIQSYDYFQEFAPGAPRYIDLRNESEDPYIFFRNLYLQGVQRDAEY